MHHKPSNKSCGAKDLDPIRPKNAPSQSVIEYRVGTQPEFLERMLWRVPRQSVPATLDHPETFPLRRLRADREGEPTGGLLDAFACSLDVLSFYSERIATEGYLPTAQERRSMIELAGTIGYALAPGVAAGTYLAFTVEDKDDPFRRVDVAEGVQAASVPATKDELPQTYETLETITARGEWNDIRARTLRNQPIAVYRDGEDDNDEKNGRIFLFDLDNSFDTDDAAPEGMVELFDDSDLARYHAITPGLDLQGALDQRREDKESNDEIEVVLRAVPIDEVYVDGLGLGLKPGQRVLAIGRSPNGEETIAEPFRIVAVSERRDFQITSLVLKRQGEPPDAVRTPPKFRTAKLKFGIIPTQPVLLGNTSLNRYVKGNAWTGDGLSAFVRTQAWSRTKLMSMLREQPIAGASGIEDVATGLHVMTEDAGFFGATAQLHDTVSFGNDENGAPIKAPYEYNWDSPGTTIWLNGKGHLIASETASESDQTEDKKQGALQAYLEREVKALQPGSWAILENTAGETMGLQVTTVATESRADYAISGKASGLAFADPNGEAVQPPEMDITNDLNAFKTRKTQAFVASKHLSLAGIPLPPVIESGVLEVDLDTLYLDFERGRPVSITGARADAEGIEGSETAIIREILHIDGVTRLLLETELISSYELTTMRINGNVAIASHGERIEEVLGSGDATLPNQSFVLRQIPLTYVSATTPNGRASTLEIRVDGILWQEVPTLFHAGPNDAVFETRLGEGNIISVHFGDGAKGRRLPTGELNVSASYRKGTGLSGHVPERTITQLKTKPLGIRAVSNPSAPSGGAEPESLEDARVTAPNTVKTLGRVVSLADYEDFARNFAGIGKARAIELWSGRAKVAHVTIAPEEDIELPSDAPVLSTLALAMDGARDISRQLMIQPYRKVYFGIAAQIVVDPAFLLEDVERDARSAIEQAYGFNARSLAQPVSSAEVIALIQGMSGVRTVDLDALYRIEGGELNAETTPPTLGSVLQAAAATGPGKRKTGAFTASELLLVLPSAVNLVMEFADA